MPERADDRIITANEIHTGVINLGYEIDRLAMEVRSANRQIAQAGGMIGALAVGLYLIARKVGS